MNLRFDSTILTWFAVLLASLSGALFVVVLALPAAAGDVTYDYDSQGRIVAAVDNTIITGTNGVQYVYDSVGNIVAINALGATGGTETFNEYPTLGRVGSSVQIYGDGFSQTPSQNTVTFGGGAAATVVSATVSTLTVTVPTGAQKGQISVVTPNNPGSPALTPTFTVTQ
jgi:YD repeat-containing protein